MYNKNCCSQLEEKEKASFVTLVSAFTPGVRVPTVPEKQIDRIDIDKALDSKSN